MSKVEINNVYKIFGSNPQSVMPMVKNGANKEEVLEMNPLIENNLIKELVSMIQRINLQKINDHENLKLKLEAIKQDLRIFLEE